MLSTKSSIQNQMIENKCLREVCTLGIGGPARYYIEVQTIDALQVAIRECKEKKQPYFILGKGSNTLFDDRGFNGCVIHNKIDFIERNKNGLIHVGAGYSFSLLGVQTAREGWSGLEFASGIPASVGGAVFMNAGANGFETKDFLISVDYVDDNAKMITLNRDEIVFKYRYSSFQDFKGAIVGATFALVPSKEARQKQLEIVHYRQKTQPYGEKSAGCVFRNPDTMSAGKLIDSCGLKEYAIGDAKVSSLHANFLLNKGHATASDFKKLIDHIREEVKRKTGIELESEVRIVPYGII